MTPNVPRESKALGRAIRDSVTGLRGLRVMKPERWERRVEEDLVVFTAPMPSESSEFTAETATEVFEWLVSQPIVPRIDVTEPVGERVEWLDRLEGFLAQFGDLSQGDPRRTVTAATRLQDGWNGTVEMYRGESLIERGVRRASLHPSLDGPLTVGEPELTVELVRLWAAVQAVLLSKRYGSKAASNQISTMMLELGHTAWLADAGDSDPTPIRRLRRWISMQLNLEQLAARVEPSVDDRPARVSLSAVSAVQLLWLILAVTIEAIEPPFETPGLHRCDYCKRLFVGDRSSVRGSNIFCSKRHGSNYWAREAMRKKRAAGRS